MLSIGHFSRASGHRFRVNDITCHPVLPLLLTTSHHNLLDAPNSPDDEIGVEEGVDKQAARAKGLPTVSTFGF